MYKLFIAFFVVSLTASYTFSQQRTCATMDMHQQQIQDDPKFLEKQVLLQKATEIYEQGLVVQNSSSFLYTIPVVVHVLYNTSFQNISDAQIYDQLNILNEDFRALNSDVSSVPANFQSLIADSQIEFCLASVDPSGNTTNGINRVYTSSSSFSSSGNPMKYSSSGGADAWNSAQYLNVWVCNLSGGLLGYAQFPGGAAATDGVVVNYTAFGSIGTAQSPYDQGRTLTHEVGHWLNLRHIWGDSSCGNDYVSDTPTQQSANYGCPAFPSVSCGNGPDGDMFMNYMDYVDDACMVMFTPGQRTRMHAALLNSRSSLISSTVCDPTIIGGCTDELANNYDSEATVDDGTCQYPCLDNIVELDLQLDCWPSETSWSLFASEGSLMQSVNVGDYTQSKEFVELDFCLPNGCYDFVLSDSYGDGLAGASYSSCGLDGYAEFTNSSGVVIAQTTVANFGYSTTLSFCVNNQILGCTDPSADNFDPEANTDDGSCTYCGDFAAVLQAATDASENGACDGAIMATAQGGSNDYTYTVLLDGAPVMNPFGLCAGDYTVVVTDNGYGCSEELSVTIAEPAADVSGCTDESATNYNPDATVDDGSCEYAACVNPSNVWVEDVVHTRARIKWDNVNADRYLIKFNGTSTTGPSTGNAVGDGLEAGTGKLKYFLEAETEYTVSMRTFCFDGTKSDWEDVVVFTTLAECNNPTVLGTDWIEAEYVGMSWEHGDNANGASKYIGQMREVGSSSWSTFASSEMLSSANPGVDQPTAYKEKAGLTVGATYEYQVKTWCNTGDANNPTDPYYRASGFGPELGTFTTVPCLAQTENLGVAYNSTNSNGASHAFSWDVNTDDVAPADRYIIQFTVAGAGNWQNRTVSGGGTATGRNIGGFTVGTEYAWRVRTYCSESPSARWRSDWVYGPNFVAGDGARLAYAPVLNLDVYPNPSRDIFNVTFASEEVQNINVKVVNMIGEEVYTEDLTEFVGMYTKSIDLNTQPKGVYFLEITTDKGGINKKIVLQ